MKISKILCPVDFSDSSEKALHYASFLASSHHAKLNLLHVIEHLHGSDNYLILAMTPKEIYEKWEKEAKEKLSALLSQVDKSVKVTTTVREGKAFVEIVRMAKELQTDMIVMGSHGRGILPQILIGSVVERVARKAPCPVLIVRAQTAEFELP